MENTSASASATRYGWLYHIMMMGAGPVLLLLCAALFRLAQCWNLWCDKMRIQKMMRRQGVYGPPITFNNLFTGHAQDILESRKWELAQPDLPVGNHDMLSRTQSFVKNCSKRYGSPFIFWWGVDATIATTDVQVVKAVLVSRFTAFTPSAQVVRNRSKAFGKHGLASQAAGDRWAHQRRLLSPAFHTAKLKGLVEAMDVSATQVIQEWHHTLSETAQGCAHIDAAEAFSRYAADVIARTAFGSSYQLGHKIFNLSTELSHLIIDNAYYSALPLYKYLPTKRNKRMAQIIQALENYIRLSVLERMKPGDEAEDDDLLSVMIKASRELGTPGAAQSQVSLQYLVDECRTFYYAGHETTNGTLQWTIMCLARYPEWQDKARLEVDDVTQGKPNITADMISKLKVLTMVLCESLRLYPVASNLTRQALEDVRVGDLLIPKGVCVYISILAMHTLPEIWGQDALEFKPERFHDGATKACSIPVAYMPFSRGRRKCIGEEFAMAASKTVLAKILQQFRFSLSPQYRHCPHVPMLLKPRHDVPLIVTRR